MSIPLKRTRNIGIIAHIDAGKTTTTERILFYTGKSYKIGEVHEGTTVMDWMPQERERGITITAAATTTFWIPTYFKENQDENNRYRINIIDTPGHIDFTAEVERSLRVLDGAVMVFDAVQGVEPQSETVWRQADKYKVPRLCFINKIDRIGANFAESLLSIREKLNKNAIPLAIPIGQESQFSGLIDLLTMQALYFEGKHGEKIVIKEIPDEFKQEAHKYHEELIEKVAELDDELTQDYLEGKKIDINKLKLAIRKGVLEYKFIPVYCGSALKNKGVQLILDGICDYLPNPLETPLVKGIDPKTNQEKIISADPQGPLVALVFKLAADPFFGQLIYIRIYSGTLKSGSYILNSTRDKQERISKVVLMHANHREEVKQLIAGEIGAVIGLKESKTGDTLCDPSFPVVLEQIKFPEPVIDMKIEPETKDDEEKLAFVLRKFQDEDPTFKVKIDKDTGDTLISGMGELHLDIITDRMKREYNVKLKTGRPQVAYKETIVKPVKNIEGKYIRQSGGRGQYGHVIIDIEPLERGKGFEFVNKIKGGIIPDEYIGPIEKGIKEAMEKGILASYELTDLKVTLHDGSYHEVDSSDIAFKIAGSIALIEAAKKAGLILLEPIMKLETVIPAQFFGKVTGDINSRRGRIENMHERYNMKVIDAKVPLAEMFGYATSLRTLTEGRGSFYMEFDHYEPAPNNIAQQIIEGKSVSQTTNKK